MEIIEVLGGRKVLGKDVRKAEDLEDKIRKGLPYASLENVRNLLNLRLETIALILFVTTRTLLRRKHEKTLATAESAQLVRLARVYQRAVEILGSGEDARSWLQQPNMTLNEKSPLQEMDTPIGEERVHTLLSRIDQGVYS